MAINLIFLAGGRKIFMVRISGREIYYNDSIQGVLMLYPNPSEKVLKMFGPPTKEDLQEYEMCKDEKELMAFIIRDCKKSGAKLIKMEEIK